MFFIVFASRYFFFFRYLNILDSVLSSLFSHAIFRLHCLSFRSMCLIITKLVRIRQISDTVVVLKSPLTHCVNLFFFHSLYLDFSLAHYANRILFCLNFHSSLQYILFCAVATFFALIAQLATRIKISKQQQLHQQRKWSQIKWDREKKWMKKNEKDLDKESTEKKTKERKNEIRKRTTK